MNGYKQKNGDIVIMLTHDRYPAIIFDQMIKFPLFGSRKEDVKENFSPENQTCSKCIPSTYS